MTRIGSGHYLRDYNITTGSQQVGWFDHGAFSDPAAKMASAVLYHVAEHLNKCIKIDCGTCYDDLEWIMEERPDWPLSFRSICDRFEIPASKLRRNFHLKWEAVGRPTTRVKKAWRGGTMCEAGLHPATYENTKGREGFCNPCYRKKFPYLQKGVFGNESKSPMGFDRLEDALLPIWDHNSGSGGAPGVREEPEQPEPFVRTLWRDSLKRDFTYDRLPSSSAAA